MTRATICLLLLLSAVQVGLSASAACSDAGIQDTLPAIDYHIAPVLGSQDVVYIVDLLFDYQCPDCQKIHFLLNETVRMYAGKLAFALCPAPLSPGCNPYISEDAAAFRNSCELARIGLAVWFAGREAFPAFDSWMFTYESGNSWHPRSLEAARTKAVELVGREKFDNALSDPRIGRYMQTCIRMYGQTIRNGRGGIPRLVYGTHFVIPESHNAVDLITIMNKSLGVPMPERK